MIGSLWLAVQYCSQIPHSEEIANFFEIVRDGFQNGCEDLDRRWRTSGFILYVGGQEGR